MSHTVAMHELRVGMFIHLDLGWMSHPFPLSSFRIASEDQIETIRGLGLEKVRWVPERSDPPEVAVAEPGLDAVTVTAGPAAAAESAAGERRSLLASQRAAARQAEAQYTEAGQACRQAFDLVGAQPAQARVHTEQLTQTLLDKMLIDGEMCVRLLSSQSGDRGTAHALNVTVISLLLGRSLGLGAADMLDLGVGALLHDVGKAELADRLRHADDHHSTAEQAAYREHVSLGLQQGKRMGLATGALLVVAQHHEHADGSGFPLKLGADRMTLAARIVAIVNRYDNLCNPQVQARALTPHEALSLLFSQWRAQFDPMVLNAFIRMMGVYPAGSLVQLTDERYAMVVGVNSSRPLKPRLLVHQPGVPRDEALLLCLERHPDIGIRRSLAPNKLPHAALEYLAPKPRVSYFFEPMSAAEMSVAEEVAA